MACSHRAAYECIAAFSATDFRPDLAKIDVPTLIIHGDDDQIVPFAVGGKRSAEMIDGAVLKVYEGRPHGLPDTDRDHLHADLLDFINS
jgi:non-heme chloroperoxidase